MITRILRVKLAEPLSEKLKEQHLSKSELAKKLGIATQTLTSMMNDDWEYINRDAIERAADYLEKSVEDIFEFAPVEFWNSIQEDKTCTFLRGVAGVRTNEPGIQIPRYDNEATQTIVNFLHDLLPGFNGGVLLDNDESEEKLLARVQNENCIVIGSPKSNAATEILISRFFGAEPHNPSQENRAKIPFGFCWPENSLIVEKSTLTCSTLARSETQGCPGIALKDVYVAADYKPENEFITWSTKAGRDCALVFVANRPFQAKKNVKLIVLAGFSGIGTAAAAKALVKNFRDLEPLEHEPCVYGVVEGRYSKTANLDMRRYREFFWRYRQGGRLPGHWPYKPQKGNKRAIDSPGATAEAST